jgi:hypothetical protein
MQSAYVSIVIALLGKKNAALALPSPAGAANRWLWL